MGLWCGHVREWRVAHTTLYVVEGGRREIEGEAFIKIRIESRSAGVFR